MKHYIGIDLGTTNSAICSFDGKETQIWKSPEQSDVTPSAIYADKRGHYYYGRKAFEKAAENEKNSATLFKRYLGTSKNYLMEEAGITLTPVECSSMLLHVLFGYLPEEIREDPETVTVITVPAAFNQMKKDATLEAARLAGIGNIALMQEPVAAVMSVLKKDDREKLFLIYDLGGGTFDISAASLVGNHVSLLAQGGKEMCGGRDMDRWLYSNRVLPWLREHFVLPADPDALEKYVDMKRIILFAVEEAKIALSSSEKASVWLDEDTLHTTDETGKEISLDMTITREDMEEIICEMARETADLAEEIMQRASVRKEEVDQIVFIGGPTMYAPLREEVCRLLGIPRGTAVNPMTAVAEGASIYAETINWDDEQHSRKASYEEIPEEDKIRIRYERRTSLNSGKIALLVSDSQMRIARITSADSVTKEPKTAAGSGFDSGRISVVRQCIIEVPLPQVGRHCFSLKIWDANENLCLDRTLEITRTMASIEAIPASHSIALKALSHLGGVPVPVYLIEANDPLPKTGMVTVHAAQRLAAGSEEALVFSLWEGEIPDPVDDNRYIGTCKIPGTAFTEGIIPVGADVVCNYEINEAGNLRLGVIVPCVGLQLPEQNFYSRLEGQIDLTDVRPLQDEIRQLLSRTSQMKLRVVDPELIDVRKKLMDLRYMLQHNTDPESIACVESDLIECYRQVAILHNRYANVMKSHDLESVLSMFKTVENVASPDEVAAFRNLEDLARYAIDQGSSDFEDLLKDMKRRIFNIRWQQDSFIQGVFKSMISNPGGYTDKAAFDRLKAEGSTCMENKDMDRLRQIINELSSFRKKEPEISVEKMLDEVSVYQ